MYRKVISCISGLYNSIYNLLLKNNFFDGTQLAEFELSKFGSTNNIDVESIKNARKEIPLFLNNYRKASFEFENQFENLGDTSTLADPTVVQSLIDNRLNK